MSKKSGICELCTFFYEDYVSWVKAGMPVEHIHIEAYKAWKKTRPPRPRWFCSCNGKYRILP